MTRSLRRSEPIELAVGLDATINLPLYTASVGFLDPSSYTAEWNLFRAVPRRGRKPFVGSAVLTKTSAASQITLTTGNAAVAIADTDLDLKSGAFWQVLTLTDGSGNITQQAQGPVTVRAAA